MNLFIVPSWYPSGSNPSYGIFVKEQIAMMARERPEWKIGVSTWGQGAEEKLIWAKDHFRNVAKFNEHAHDRATISNQDGYKEYYQPALSWSKKIGKGNLKEIIRCNELNYQAHSLEFGKPDLIMVQACYPGILIANHLAQKYEIPIHLHIRLGGFMFEHMLGEMGATLRNDLLQGIAQAQLVTVTSDFHQEELRKWVSGVTRLYNPVDLDFFQRGEQSGDFAIAVGRLEKEKGFDLLLDAVSKVPELKLKIVGSGEERSRLENQIKRLNLEERVSMVGEKDRKEVKSMLQKSKFMILPSRYETFGNVLLEAMACGKPVVATKCGGPQEIVTPDVGYLADINPEDLCSKINQMAQDTDSFDSQVIRTTAKRSFSSIRWIENLEKLFKEFW